MQNSFAAGEFNVEIVLPSALRIEVHCARHALK
jgi:hypothetical protein